MQGHRKPGLFSRVAARSGSPSSDPPADFCKAREPTSSRDVSRPEPNVYLLTCVLTYGRTVWHGTKERGRERRVSRCLGTVADPAPSISTQSNGRIRMRMRCAGGAEPEVGGQTANLVPIVSAVVLGSSLPSRRLLFSARSSPRPLFRGFHAYESV